MTGPREPHSTDNKQNTPDCNHEESREERQRSTPNKSETTPESKDQKQEAHYHRRDWLDNVNALLLFGAFLAAIAAAIFTLKQINLARDTAFRELRAYVYAAPGPVFHIDGEAPLQGYVVIGNSGQTFAQKVIRKVGMRVLGATVPEKVEDLGRMDREEGVMVISPREKHAVIRNRDRLTPEEVAKIWRSDQGAKRIYVFGTITYEDIYGKRHHTDFCHMYFGKEHWLYDSGPGYHKTQGKYCDKHNSAD